MLRKKDLCPGAEYCPYSPRQDPRWTSEPSPCEECPLELLETYLASPQGLLIGHVIDLDFALQSGITVGLSEITYPEFLLLRQLADERGKHHQEEIESKSGRQPHIPTGRSQLR
jgi:hypothetical protein